MVDDDMEAQLRAKAEREGEMLFTPEIPQMLAREIQQAKRLPIDEWIALLHQIPVTAQSAPEIPNEALRCENMYEDRA